MGLRIPGGGFKRERRRFPNPEKVRRARRARIAASNITVVVLRRLCGWVTFGAISGVGSSGLIVISFIFGSGWVWTKKAGAFWGFIANSRSYIVYRLRPPGVL